MLRLYYHEAARRPLLHEFSDRMSLCDRLPNRVMGAHFRRVRDKVSVTRHPMLSEYRTFWDGLEYYCTTTIRKNRCGGALTLTLIDKPPLLAGMSLPSGCQFAGSSSSVYSTR